VISAPATGRLGVPLTLNASTSTATGSIVSYRWSLGQRPAGSAVPSLPLVSTSPLLTFAPDRLGRYDIQLLVVDDGGNQSAPVIATILVTDTDNPTAILDATPASPEVGSSMTLSGSRSSDTGGGAIQSYLFSAVVRPAGATAFATPVNSAGPTISFIPDRPGTWQLRLVVTDDAGNQSAPDNISVIVIAGLPPFALERIASRKTHGAAGTFDLLLKQNVPVSGAVTVEPRISQAGHKIVFSFNQPVSSLSDVIATDANGAEIGAASATIDGSDVVVSLAGIANARRVKVQLKGVNGELDSAATVGFLFGDVNSSRLVDGSDVSAIKSRAGQVAGSGNFRFDVTANGVINVTDVLVVKFKQGATMP